MEIDEVGTMEGGRMVGTTVERELAVSAGRDGLLVAGVVDFCFRAGFEVVVVVEVKETTARNEVGEAVRGSEGSTAGEKVEDTEGVTEEPATTSWPFSRRFFPLPRCFLRRGPWPAQQLVY